MFNSKKLFATEAVVDNLLRVESYHILHCPTAIDVYKGKDVLKLKRWSVINFNVIETKWRNLLLLPHQTAPRDPQC